MLRNYLTIAFRNLQRDIAFSYINIAGLSLGMASSLLIALWVWNEISYDSFHSNQKQLTKVWSNTFVEGEIESRSAVPPLLYKELLKYAEIKSTSLSNGETPHLLTYGDKKIKLEGRNVSPEFLEMFQFDLIQGTARQVLTDPHSIVLTQATATILFGNDDPLNKLIQLDNQFEVKVTGILKDIPPNSSFRFDYLLPFSLFESNTVWAKECMNDWDCDWLRVYAELQPDAKIEVVNEKIKNIIRDHASSLKKDVFLYPMDRWHLHGNFSGGQEASSDGSDFVANLAWLAAIILVIACINFMNLSTARSERRAREVGIRKVFGSNRKQLIFQFLGESLLLSVIAFLFALVIVQLSLPLYNSLVQKQLYIDFSSPLFWLVSLLVVSLTGLLAGCYPAFFLSSFNPAKVLKGKISVNHGSTLPRKVLVVLQFTCSIVLIVATIVIYQQINFAQARYLGFDMENLVTVPDNSELSKNYTTIKQKLIESGAASSVTKTNSPITDIYEVNYIDWPENKGGPLTFTNIFCEYDYCQTMGIKLLQGRDFLREYASDSSGVIVNQTAVDMMGLSNPIGAQISIDDTKLTILGVTEDIVMSNQYEKVDPLYMVLQSKWSSLANHPNITIRLKNINQLKQMEAIIKTNSPSFPLEYSFVDSDYQQKFSYLKLTARLINIFAFLAITIASLGLFGLAAFRAQQRTKEIGIRKIMGASATTIMKLLTTDFLKQIIISLIIAIPISWYAMNQWLQSYPYRIEIAWWVFAVSGIIASTIAFVTVSSQAFKTANSNPVDSLRSE